MTPKEKAIELVDKFIFIDNGEKFQIISIADEKRAIQCALIAVDEIIKALRKNLPIFELGKGFWQDVKKEIKRL